MATIDLQRLNRNLYSIYLLSILMGTKLKSWEIYSQAKRPSFDFTLPLHFLCMMCPLDDFTCHSKYTLLLKENIEVCAHILQNLDLLLQELLLLLNLCFNFVQEQVLRLLPLCEYDNKTILEVVNGANLVHLYSHLFAFRNNQTKVSLKRWFVTRYGGESRHSV
jgi:hypothetical protein